MSSHTRTSVRHGRQNGISIVESLVALVILSIGMLGIAGLYLQSVQANRTALARTVAVQLVNDMADRIRSNRSGRGDYSAVKGTPPTAPAATCTTASCTPAQLAKQDIWVWYQSVVAALPKGGDGKTTPQVAVTYTPGATSSDPDRYVVETAWKEPGSDDFLSTQVEVFQIGSATS